jgi:protein MpaA
MEVLKSVKTKLGNKVELIGNSVCENPALIIGVFHGDEPQGKYLIEKYLSHCKSNQISSLFIPCLNPDGMQLGQRTNANGVDLNRNFPTKNWGQDTSQAGDNPLDYFGGSSAGSEIETQFVIDVIEKYQPSKILTLHAPYKVVNYDGPAEELAQEISKIINYPVEASIGYPTPGSFGTYAGVERQIPTITLELDEICPVEDLVEPLFRIFNEFL